MMVLRKQLIVSALAGLIFSGIGFGMVAIGGWGPCGPGSNLSNIGGWISLYQPLWLATIFPGLENLLTRTHLDIPFILLVPVLTWTVVSFIVLALRYRVPAGSSRGSFTTN